MNDRELVAERDTLSDRLRTYVGDAISNEAADALDAQAARLRVLEIAAWDVCEIMSDVVDSPVDYDLEDIIELIDALGKLLPATRLGEET